MADKDQTGDEEIRRQLIRLIGKRGCRKQKWSKDRPTDWRPSEIYDPESKVALTTPAAWELILQWLTKGCSFETKEMTLPGGKKVEVHSTVEQLGDQMIYVKLEILDGGQSVFGWSFHVSERTFAKNDAGR